MDPLDRQHKNALALQAFGRFSAHIGPLSIKDDFEPLPSPIHCGSYDPARPGLLAVDTSSCLESLLAAREQLKWFEQMILEAAKITISFNLCIAASRLLRRQRHFQRCIRSAMAYHVRHEARRGRRAEWRRA